MSPLSEVEKQKIIEEERIRAEERSKYAQSQPQQVIVKEKRSSGAAIGCLALIIIGVLVLLVQNSLGNAREKANEAREAAESTLRPSIDSDSPESATILDYAAAMGRINDEVRNELTGVSAMITQKPDPATWGPADKTELATRTASVERAYQESLELKVPAGFEEGQTLWQSGALKTLEALALFKIGVDEVNSTKINQATTLVLEGTALFEDANTKFPKY